MLLESGMGCRGVSWGLFQTSRDVEISGEPSRTPSGPGHHAWSGDELADLRGMLDRVTG